MPIHPTPLTWTLRFKNNKTTIVLHVEKTQLFSSIKKDLLQALKETQPDGSLNDNPIPDHIDDILLARQVDSNDPDAGWEGLDSIVDDAAFDEEADKKTKGKGKGNSNAGGITDCPLGAGIKDGGILAFKFRAKAHEGAQKSIFGDGGVGEADQKWDVVLAKYEDIYPAEEDEDDDKTIGEPEGLEMT